MIAVTSDDNEGGMGKTARTLLALLPAALVLVAGPALGLSLAAPARADVWVVPSDAKVFPTTPPSATATPAITLSAARNEYEAAQIVVSGANRRRVAVSWADDSDPLLLGAADLFKIGYVMVRRPSTGVGSRPGLYPDPLLPATFGAPTVALKGATSFYLRLHVPVDATAGLYHGTILVADPASGGPVAVPVTLQVWDFGWIGRACVRRSRSASSRSCAA